MAKFTPPIIIQDSTGWHLMSPSNPWEALKIAWMMWRHPTRVAALIGVGLDYPGAHWQTVAVDPSAGKPDDA